jgi:integrase
MGMSMDRLVKLMGHGSKQMVYEVYGKYVEGLEADAEEILAFFGPDFLVLRGKEDVKKAFATSSTA